MPVVPITPHLRKHTWKEKFNPKAIPAKLFSETFCIYLLNQNMRKQALLLPLILLSITNNINSQGCSDAGVCTIHSIKGNVIEKPGMKETHHEITLATGYARGERGTDIYTLQLEYILRLKSDFSVSGKMNYNSIKGELGKISGPGDVFLSIEKGFAAEKKWKKFAFAGFKIPLGDVNKKNNGLSLPMVYQPTLGTTDLLAGVSLTNKYWGISLAYQQPMNNPNGNGFLQSQYPAMHTARNYPSTNRFSRKADLVTRISRNFITSRNWTFQPGLLGIYHTGTDTYQDETGRQISINGSAGLTLNALLNLQIKTGVKSNIAFSAGTPLLVRAERPDGLTRKFVLSLEYAFRF